MDPYQHKHPAGMLAVVHTAIQPALAAAGFQFTGRNNPELPLYLHIDYARANEMFTLSFEKRDRDDYLGFAAELTRDSEEAVTIAVADLSDIPMIQPERDYPQMMSRIAAFVDSVNEFLSCDSSSH